MGSTCCPLLAGAGQRRRAGDVLASVGAPDAKAALEMAWLDLELRVAAGHWPSTWGGARRGGLRRLGGHHDTTEELLETVAGYVDEGYRRIKLKIEPGLDIDRVRRCGSGSGRDAAPGRRQRGVHLEDAEHSPGSMNSTWC